ncbi:hypothetical protein HQ487_03725 [Candidatus Uhrbacteria bacterium]|nr:hypothetical protein [Candidatus Uhrbacteria bacterium]
MAKNWIDAISHFNDQTLEKDEWTHEAHLVVGLWHLLTYEDVYKALCFLKPKIILRNHRVGVENTASRGYHETITLFWLQEIDTFVRSQAGSKDIFTLIDALLQERIFRRKDYIFQFYSKDELMSPRARAMFIPRPPQL